MAKKLPIEIRLSLCAFKNRDCDMCEKMFAGDKMPCGKPRFADLSQCIDKDNIK